MKEVTLSKSVETEKNSHDKKNITIIILILGFLSALGPFSIDMYLPGFPAIATDFNTTISRVGLSLTSYFIGISVGQLIYGPLLDRYGRKKPLIFGLALYIISSIGCAVSPNLNFLIRMRLLSALGSCVGMVAGRAIVRDLFPANEVAKVFSVLMLVMGIAPIIAPTTGGLILSFLGWRYIFGLLAIISGLMLFSVVFFLPESKGADHTISLKFKNVFSEYIKVMNNRTFITYTLAGALAMSGMFAYISGSPFVYMKLFGMTEKIYGIFFGLNATALILGSQINRFVLNKLTSEKIIRITISFQLLGAILLFSGNYLDIVGKDFTLFLVFTYLFWLGFLNPNISALALEPFKKNAGSAAALSGSIQMIFSALITGLVSFLQNGTAIPMVSIMALCALISFILIFSSGKSETKYN